MFSTADLIWGVIVPPVWAAMVLLVSSLPWRRRQPRVVAPWGPALAIAGGFAIAYIATVGRPAFPPVEAQGWLVYLAAAAVAISIIATLPAIAARWLAATLSLVTLAATAYFIVRPRQAALSPSAFWSCIAVGAAGMVVWWAAMETLAARVRGIAVPALLAVFAIAAAMVLMNGHTRAFAQLAFAAALPLLAMVALGWLLKLDLSRGGVLATAIIVLGLLLGGHHFADVTPREMELIALAPLAAWIGMLPALRRRRWLAVLAATVAVGTVLAFILPHTINGLYETYREETQPSFE